MRIGFIGDIVGRPGRQMLKSYLPSLREEFGIDYLVANYENASHGFGLTKKNANELYSSGADLLTGGNHTFDKKDVHELFAEHAIIRPINYPPEVSGKGIFITDVGGEKLAVINVMGQFSMPHSDNPFRLLKSAVQELKEQNIKNILVDMHAEATSEKRATLMMLQHEVSAIFGTHTHVGTDDLVIQNGCAYVSDVGLTGCRDNVIGMDDNAPIARMLTGLGKHYDVPDKCKKILQMIVVDMEDGSAKEAFKIRLFDDGRRFIQEAYFED